MSELIAIGAIAAVLAVVVGMAYALRPESPDIEARLARFGARRVDHWEESGRTEGRSQGSVVAQKLEKALEGRSFAQNLQAELARANLKLTVSEFLALEALCTAGAAILVFALTQFLITAILFGVAGFYLPRLWVVQRQASRLKAFNAQLADTISLLSSSLRAGMSLVQAMEMVAREASPPISEEFARVVREIGLGVGPQEALRNLVRRVKSDDVDLLVTAIVIQHEVGGNLARILDTIAHTIRERIRIKGEIRSLTAQQKISGIILAALPAVLGGVLMLLSPSYMMRMFAPGPWVVLPAAAALMITIGFLVIRKIVDIEV